MFRHDANEPIVPELLKGTIVAVEAHGSPIDVLMLTYGDGRRIIIMASDDVLHIGEENVPEA